MTCDYCHFLIPVKYEKNVFKTSKGKTVCFSCQCLALFKEGQTLISLMKDQRNDQYLDKILEKQHDETV
jgi:hypothetical protein